jgi:ABC-type Zn uptake system ZnuABC Zn-binding protein ZnuA
VRHFALILTVILLFSACGGPAAREASQTTAPDVLATTTFLADIARNVAGDHIGVESLLPFGADPHSYQPIPADAVKINKSNVLIMNGLDYEQFLTSLLENAGGERFIITASDGLEPRQMEEGGEIAIDPHMWLDPNRVIKYVENIRDGLSQVNPNGAAIYKSNADAYIAKLQDLDGWIKEQVSQIPSEQRLLVTNHESLGYFSENYGFTVIGEVLQSVSSVASPSAQQMAALVDQIKTSGAPAIFLDASDNPTLAQQIADETGVKVVTDLHLESLTDGPPAATYIEMMKYNLTQIVNALH